MGLATKVKRFSLLAGPIRTGLNSNPYSPLWSQRVVAGEWGIESGYKCGLWVLHYFQPALN
ncbi:MAG TPA: hypothetical protein DDW52_20460 [Planctomycetaceae bacterium]|nr:hypothetical protein [Planctomycetaceae bacterium]